MKFCSAFLLISAATLSAASPIHLPSEHPSSLKPSDNKIVIFKQIVERAPGANPETPRAKVKREVVSHSEAVPLEPTTLIKLSDKVASVKDKRVIDNVLKAKPQDTVLVDLADATKLPIKRDTGGNDERKKHGFKAKRGRKNKGKYSKNRTQTPTNSPAEPVSPPSSRITTIDPNSHLNTQSSMSGGLVRYQSMGRSRNQRRDTGGNDVRQRQGLNHRRDTGGNEARKSHGF